MNSVWLTSRKRVANQYRTWSILNLGEAMKTMTWFGWGGRDRTSECRNQNPARNKQIQALAKTEAANLCPSGQWLTRDLDNLGDEFKCHVRGGYHTMNDDEIDKLIATLQAKREAHCRRPGSA